MWNGRPPFLGPQEWNGDELDQFSVGTREDLKVCVCVCAHASVCACMCVTQGSAGGGGGGGAG